MASAKKLELHPEKITTFVVDRNINYTNICWVDCKFCAFYRHARDEDAYVLTYEEIDAKIDELLAIGGTQILFQGGVHPKLKIDFYEDLVEHIHTKYPMINIHGFSSIEITYISKISKISYSEVIRRLKEKGLASIPGAGAEILNDEVRDIIAPKKHDVKD
ncbi:F420, menaquinone cofactor biosynthesis like protein, partial [Aduncisulcus paluster]